ncbi:hypothetical protein [Kangiella sediminilitoris]|uniref:Transmembrane protein n=1 Tax=Kangiella sediminilitoris TaxID=1144748 RepID=A0A1B3B9N9_9GAMM|nr:hypothetical protein [Kangiella sediminilitoris]AOE49478.1 hypothetical protein KS2013_754 [Kangiella sediminilitoris]
MAEMACEICGAKVTQWSARFESDIMHCKKCIGTSAAKEFIERKYSDGSVSDPKEPVTLSKQNTSMATTTEQNIDYMTSIIIGKVVSAIGWLTCVFAVVVVLSTFDSMGLLSLASGFGVLIGGLILVISGQTLRAVIDSANYSKLMLEEMRKK